ncbi:MAG: hypothetical protein M3391_07040 [Actinomycetota bacterium]|nr:hypothetical protein [Actinomycetota bacterium]
MSSARLLAGVWLVAMAVVLVFAGTALAQEAQEDPYASDEPKGSQIIRESDNPNDNPNENPNDDVLGERTATEAEGSSLPFTGGDIVLVTATGAALVLTGMAIVRRVRASRGEI